MSVVAFLQAMLRIMQTCFAELNRLVLDNGTMSVGFASIMVGFVVVNILIQNYVR